MSAIARHVQNRVASITTGQLASTMQVALIAIGTPHQIYTIWEQGSVNGISIVYLWLQLCACMLWLKHGSEVHDRNIMIPQIPAIILTLVMIGEFYYYA